MATNSLFISHISEEAEYAALERSILAEGCRDALKGIPYPHVRGERGLAEERQISIESVNCSFHGGSISHGITGYTHIYNLIGPVTL